MSSNKLEKSKGILLFAFDTANTDYVEIADRCSKLAQFTTGLPITLVTDDTAEPKFAYDRVIRVPSSEGNYRIDLKDRAVEWRNFGRYLAYELSPYNETLLIDSDYLLFDCSVLKLFEQTFDYKLMYHNHTPDGPSYELMGNTSLPFVWATVVLFKKCVRSKMLFDLVGRIQRNYGYYRALYNLNAGNYRNDYAFAIANIILNGYTISEQQSIPWTMFTLDKPVDKIIKVGNFLQVKQESPVVVPLQNIHLMDKDYLLSENFKQLLTDVTT
jgi:hypothetical protein